jgi:type II secretory pathway pseudopilin PulG
MPRARGFTYLGVIFVIGLMGVLLASSGTIWSQSAQREKEKELIHVGNQLRRAIGLYYERSPGTVKRYPQTIEDLLFDSRYLTMQRYLRRIYADPMTGKAEWGLVRAPDGGIMGVYSMSDAEPIKVGNFRMNNVRFTHAKRYGGWQFVYVPDTVAAQTQKPQARK